MFRPSILFLLTTTVALYLGSLGAAGAGQTWIGTWGASTQPVFPGTPQSFENQTLRMIVHTSVAGTRIRVTLSNALGEQPLTIGSARVARRVSGASVDTSSDRVLTFDGSRAVSIPAGETVTSDSVDLDVPALADLAVSVYFPTTAVATTSHFLALQTNYISTGPGDLTAAATFNNAKTITSWPFLSGVDVVAPQDAATVVVFGDSTVDGDGSTSDTNRRWPDAMAERLQKHSSGRLGIVNAGIIGNRLLRDSPQQAGSEFGAALGRSGLARFEHDVLAQTGVRYVIVRIGINDIGFPGALSPATEHVTAANLISGYRQLIAKAHARGVRIIGTTLSPFENAAVAAGYYSPEKEKIRQNINTWIRANRDFDAVIDIDAVLRDPGHLSRLLPEYDSGDHLHPNDAGYLASANAVPLEIFKEPAGVGQTRRSK
jgi:lysophospholipase L1-like esterase